MNAVTCQVSAYRYRLIRAGAVLTDTGLADTELADTGLADTGSAAGTGSAADAGLAGTGLASMGLAGTGSAADRVTVGIPYRSCGSHSRTASAAGPAHTPSASGIEPPEAW